MKIPLLKSFVIGSCLLTSHCQTTTLRDQGTTKLSTTPTYDSAQAFYFWGLVGEHHINAGLICGGRRIKQMAATSTFTDVALTIVSVGIYFPRTAQIWCEDFDDYAARKQREKKP